MVHTLHNLRDRVSGTCDDLGYWWLVSEYVFSESLSAEIDMVD
jgi:hypothetical protein